MRFHQALQPAAVQLAHWGEPCVHHIQVFNKTGPFQICNSWADQRE